MDTEQLKMILEVVRGAGDGAKDVAIMYLVVALAKPVLATGTIIAVACIVGRVIQRCVNATHDATVAWKKVCESAGVYPASYPDAHDIKRITDRIREK